MGLGAVLLEDEGVPMFGAIAPPLCVYTISLSGLAQAHGFKMIPNGYTTARLLL